MSDFLTVLRDAVTELAESISDEQKERIISIREKRKEHIKIMGGPPLRDNTEFDPALELALEEAHLRGFEYDLCIVSPQTYKSLNDIPVSVPTPGNHYGKLRDVVTESDRVQMHYLAPPVNYNAGDYNITLTYSQNIEQSLLVNSQALTSRVEL
jgi:hypothetical protein